MSGVCRELEMWNKSNSDELAVQSELDNHLNGDMEDPKVTFLETVDILLAEHKTEEALLVLDAEEKSSPELKDLGDDSTAAVSAFKAAFLKRKAMLVEQLVMICEQPSFCLPELKKALSGLTKLGKGSLAQQLLLKAYGSRLQKSIESFLPLCTIYSETYAASLSKLVFSTISLATKESTLLFGDMPSYTNRIVQWAEFEIESFVRLVKENSPSPETICALRAASVCIQGSLSHCSLLESEGLKFSKLLMVLLRPHVEEILDLNFRRSRRRVLDLARDDDVLLPSAQVGSSHFVASPSNIILTSSGKKFMSIVKDILDQLTPLAVIHFGGTILNKILQVFDRYIETLIKALPGPSEDDSLMESKDSLNFRAETDAQQVALLGTAFTVADELLPMAVLKTFARKIENKEAGGGCNEGIGQNLVISAAEYKEWRRHLQHSWDKLRDHFCRQYVLTFIYSREGKARLDARIYLEGKGDDLFWDCDPLPSLPFQALFGRLQQLASVVGDVLLGKEKIQKVLLSRLTETVVMWLSDEQEFWDVFEDEYVQLQPFGLQQLILDMHFIVEIAVCGGYSSRNVHQLVSAVITRAIGTFSAKGVDPQSALPEDEWFVDTAKSAINKLMLGTSGSETSELDEHIILHDESSDFDETPLSPSSIESVDSFASANTGVIESPTDLTEPEA
ncbi:exocyst complex component EXO84C isoform X2 [Ananas comosus]|nr:exocyst complex component EXO84C isoform X2 [Ananas comosus]